MGWSAQPVSWPLDDLLPTEGSSRAERGGFSCLQRGGWRWAALANQLVAIKDAGRCSEFNRHEIIQGILIPRSQLPRGPQYKRWFHCLSIALESLLKSLLDLRAGGLRIRHIVSPRVSPEPQPPLKLSGRCYISRLREGRRPTAGVNCFKSQRTTELRKGGAAMYHVTPVPMKQYGCDVVRCLLVQLCTSQSRDERQQTAFSKNKKMVYLWCEASKERGTDLDKFLQLLGDFSDQLRTSNTPWDLPVVYSSDLASGSVNTLFYCDTWFSPVLPTRRNPATIVTEGYSVKALGQKHVKYLNSYVYYMSLLSENHPVFIHQTGTFPRKCQVCREGIGINHRKGDPLGGSATWDRSSLTVRALWDGDTRELLAASNQTGMGHNTASSTHWCKCAYILQEASINSVLSTSSQSGREHHMEQRTPTSLVSSGGASGKWSRAALCQQIVSPK